MRLYGETLRGDDLSLGDGIRVNTADSWAHTIPDPDEPTVHLYAEATTDAAAAALEARFVALIDQFSPGSRQKTGQK